MMFHSSQSLGMTYSISCAGHLKCCNHNNLSSEIVSLVMERIGKIRPSLEDVQMRSF